MIEAMSGELEIDIETLGSTTFHREDLAKGLEPDECYYVAHFSDIQGKDQLDLTIDPPPDLAIEVDVTSRSIPREPIYAALGVPELWRFDGRRLTVRQLQPDGTYADSPVRTVFPFLPMGSFEEFVLRMKRERQLIVLKEFRSWLRTLPRQVS